MSSQRLIALTLILFPLAMVYGQPPSFTQAVYPLDEMYLFVPEMVDLDPFRTEDAIRDQKGGPYRFAVGLPVDITIESHGMWEQLDDETFLWRLPILSPGALSLGLSFGSYHMPPSGRLFVYSQNHNHVTGPFTEANNREQGRLRTTQIQGDSIIIEIVIALNDIPALYLHLTSVNHAYRGYDSRPKLKALYDAGKCNTNVACPDGDSLRDQIRSVAKIEYETKPNFAGVYSIVSGTGCLINNTARDGKPYILTAFHIFDFERDYKLTQEEKNYANEMKIIWNFEAATCSGSYASISDNQTGATFLAGDGMSDVALVELEDKPDSSSNVYYAGWERISSVPAAGTAIHHPQGDIKKISRENDTLANINLKTEDDIFLGRYFMVNEWDMGTTEDGSSGCPLFNQSKRVVAVLSLGYANCSVFGPDYFGPIYRMWNAGTTPETQLSHWLDPTGSSVTFQDGKNPAKEVVVGTGTKEWEYPIRTWWHDSRTQVIYLASEIGRSGIIESLALDITKIPTQTLNNWTIRMKQTNASSESSCKWDSSGWTAWTVVYQADETINETGWRRFIFQTPFEFNSSENLLIDFSHNNTKYTSDGFVRATEYSVNRSVTAYADSTAGDPLDWSEASTKPTSTCSDYVPNIKLEMSYEDIYASIIGIWDIQIGTKSGSNILWNDLGSIRFYPDSDFYCEYCGPRIDPPGTIQEECVNIVPPWPGLRRWYQFGNSVRWDFVNFCGDAVTTKYSGHFTSNTTMSGEILTSENGTAGVTHWRAEKLTDDPYNPDWPAPILWSSSYESVSQ